MDLTLHKVFHTPNWLTGETGKAHIAHTVFSKDNERFGSFSLINPLDLFGRRYKVGLCDGKPDIILLDTFIDPTLPDFCCYNFITDRVKVNLKRRRYMRYLKGKLSYMDIFKRLYK
jgi:hypothetical protein